MCSQEEKKEKRICVGFCSNTFGGDYTCITPDVLTPDVFEFIMKGRGVY